MLISSIFSPSKYLIFYQFEMLQDKRLNSVILNIKRPPLIIDINSSLNIIRKYLKLKFIKTQPKKNPTKYLI